MVDVKLLYKEYKKQFPENDLASSEMFFRRVVRDFHERKISFNHFIYLCEEILYSLEKTPSNLTSHLSSLLTEIMDLDWSLVKNPKKTGEFLEELFNKYCV